MLGLELQPASYLALGQNLSLGIPTECSVQSPESRAGPREKRGRVGCAFAIGDVRIEALRRLRPSAQSSESDVRA